MTEDKKMKAPHSLILEDRKHLTVTGVSDVDSFDDQVVVAYTDFGELTVRGKKLHINKLNLESGELTFDGEISSMVYTDEGPKSKGLLSSLFK